MDSNQILENLIARYPVLAVSKSEIFRAFELMRNSYKQEGKLLVCGNGGSASDAEHIVGELMKSFTKKRPLSSHLSEELLATSQEHGPYLATNLEGALPAIALTCHAALNTAFSNDVDADLIYAQQVVGYGKPGDVLIGISTSGNAKNVINAVITAKAKGLKTIGLTGKLGGKLNENCDVVIHVNATETYQVQELHLPVYHALCQMLEATFY
ncbi:SIS domain-containing protein [Maribellus sp. CM-23]|uniref:D-sedoheptulose-7-phosphate isomerase n=1 Tax=Maribellus sp. CM-23 TaxID=2781026 RepID=UPI001F3A05A1|nr:SIS domain-containing protein [Maribellus sp. CM-23]MCE4565019.1 SIS domain-containing protein [Maribellus sp. CM-23]